LTAVAAVLPVPSPKLQALDEMLPVDWHVKVTVRGATPERALTVKPATGAATGMVALTSFEKPLHVDPLSQARAAK
jgi:hypothetical protein